MLYKQGSEAESYSHVHIHDSKSLWQCENQNLDYDIHSIPTILNTGEISFFFVLSPMTKGCGFSSIQKRNGISQLKEF